MKTCTSCKQPKELSEFNKDSRSKDGHFHWCRLCKNDKDRGYYGRNRDKVLERNSRDREFCYHKILKYLESNPCVDCGESDILVLEFDHRPGEIKVDSVFSIAGGRSSWEMVEQEIQKCDVRCANCHSRVTHSRSNSVRFQYVQKNS